MFKEESFIMKNDFSFLSSITKEISFYLENSFAISNLEMN